MDKVEIVWQDANSGAHGWTPIGEAADLPLREIRTVAHIVARREDAIVVAQDHDPIAETVSGFGVIPIANIRSLRILHGSPAQLELENT